MGVHGSNTWKRVNGALIAAVDRDFERAVLPLMRIFWPQMIAPRGLGAYDKAGVDLLAFGEGDRIECAVQCKGFFKAEGLLDDQFPPIAASIRKFARSGLKAKTFILVHNQDSRNENVAAQIEDSLAALLTSGNVEEVFQWDRRAFLKAVEARLRKLLADRLAEQSALMLRQLDEQFIHGGTYVAKVPVRHRLLSLRRGRAPEIKEVRQRHLITDVADTLANAPGRWTLLTGLYGSGKTTAALHAALSSPHRILYVHASTLLARHGAGGTNSLMTRILEALAVFGDFEEDERGIFSGLSGPILRQILSAGDFEAVLIIDALDENRSLATPEGITQFASSLAELVCPIILTTREEHFRATFGNFDHLFDELSTKGGNTGAIALLSLEAWQDEQVHQLVEAVAAEEPQNEALARFSNALRRGNSASWDKDLLRHPLYLRMIVDLAAEGFEPSGRRAELMEEWIWRKLARDLKAARLTPVQVVDRDEFIDRMLNVMTRVAAAMTVEGPGGLELTEALPSDEVVAIVQDVFGVSGVPLAAAISVSLLVPTSIRFRQRVPIRFSHRGFQEYFLARHAVQGKEPVNRYPASVGELAEEILKHAEQVGKA